MTPKKSELTASLLFFALLAINSMTRPLHAEEIPTATSKDSQEEKIPEAGKTPIPATTPTQPAQPVPATQEESFRSYGVTLSAQIPHPVFLDVEKRFSKDFDIALGAGGLNLKFTSGGYPVQLGIGALDLRGRWHPFGGGFFLGAALGIQTLSAKATDKIAVQGVPGYSSVDVDVSVKIFSPYITPHFGWIWYFQSGFILGFDFGWQVPFSAKTELALSSAQNLTQAAIGIVEQTQEYKNLNAEVQKAGDQIGKISLPYATVLRLGWSF